MRLYRSISALPTTPDTRVVTIGVFDGLHAGHEAILARARAEADARRESCLVFTFEPTPKEFFTPTDPPPRLTRFRERFERLAALGVEELLCTSFGAVREIRADDFVASLIVGRLHARHVVVGDDFRYGAGRGGTVADLRAAGERHGFRVTEVAPVFWRGRRVSSTASNTTAISAVAAATTSARSRQPARGRYTPLFRRPRSKKTALNSPEHAVAAAMPACAGAAPVATSVTTNTRFSAIPSDKACTPIRTGVRVSCRAK